MGRQIKKTKMDEGTKLIISLDDLNEDLSEEDVHEEKLLELQLTMATTSINHEYARIEFDEADDYERKEELLSYMSECRSKYLAARGELENYNPNILEDFERNLILQKLTTITNYHA
jgi:hypothetical protein